MLATPRADGSPDGPQSKTLAIDGNLLHVDYRADDRTTSLYADSGRGSLPVNANAVIEKIGQRFDQVLALGQHQDMFTGFPPGK